MQSAKTSEQFENSVFEIRTLRKIHALLQDVPRNVQCTKNVNEKARQPALSSLNGVITIL